MTNEININVDEEIKNKVTETQVIKRNDVSFEGVNKIPSKEMLESLKEINEMIDNPKKYPRYNNREDLKKALLSDD